MLVWNTLTVKVCQAKVTLDMYMMDLCTFSYLSTRNSYVCFDSALTVSLLSGSHVDVHLTNQCIVVLYFQLLPSIGVFYCSVLAIS